MKFVFLGTTGYHPNNRRHTASIMFPEIGLVLDAGTGFFRVRDFLQTSKLHVFLSHAHLDHCMGLSFLFDTGFERNLDSTTVYGEQSKLNSIKQNLFSEFLFPAEPPLGYKAVDEQLRSELPIGLPDETQLTVFPLRHPGGSLGFLIEQQGKKVAYVTDTTASLEEPYLKLIEDVDILIHECYFPDGYEEKAELTGHSCATPVAEVAKAVGAKKLFCVHVNPLDETDDPIGLSSIRKIFPNSYIPEDLDEVIV